MKVQLWEPTKIQPSQQKRGFFSSFLNVNRGPLTIKSQSGAVYGLAWSPDNAFIAGATHHHRVVIWDTRGGHSWGSYGPGSAGMINSVAWSRSSSYLASGSNNKTVEVYNVLARRSTSLYRGHTGYVMAVAWSPDGTRIASAGVDRTVQVWKAL
jgi:WD40 repeat protein